MDSMGLTSPAAHLSPEQARQQQVQQQQVQQQQTQQQAQQQTQQQAQQQTQQQAQLPAQQQQRIRVYIRANGEQIGEAQLRYMCTQVTHAHQQNAPVPEHLGRELRWMISQHNATHAGLRGIPREPPPTTVPRVLRWWQQTGPGKGIWHTVGARQSQPGDGQATPQQQAQQRAQNSAQQTTQHNAESQQTPRTGQPQWPNSRSPNIMAATTMQSPTQSMGQPNRQPLWPNNAPNMIPAQYGDVYQSAQARQAPRGVPIDPALANSANAVSATTPGRRAAQLVADVQSALQTAGPLPSPAVPYSPGMPHSLHAQHAAAIQTQRPGSRPSPAMQYGQGVRSPSQPSPYGVNQRFAEPTAVPPFSPTRAPSQPMRPALSRKNSYPVMGMLAPPSTRSPSIQGDAPLQQRQTVPGLVDLNGRPIELPAKRSTPRPVGQLSNTEGITPEQVESMNPKQRKHYEWVKSLKAQERAKQAAAAAQALLMPPPGTSSEVVDLTGSSKRKNPPTSEEQLDSKKRKQVQQGNSDNTVKPKKPRYQATSVEAARFHQQQQQDPNCGFGDKTKVFRNPNASRHVSPSPQDPLYAPPSPPLVLQRFPQAPVPAPKQRPTNIPDEELHAHALIHGACLADIDRHGYVGALHALQHDDRNKPMDFARQYPNARPLAKHAPEPSIALAMHRVKTGQFDLALGDGYVGHTAASDVEGCVRDADGGLRAKTPEMSEERAQVEFWLGACEEV